ncbi:Uncharacterized protein M6B38_210260 [Iris pallida]|uniref:J domain-containing protein n=1 Tax=Iris pallida TaxID=29817 RepID=A0AAX6E3X5_IRIPA|nr:Uncharacterized protein M6B38_210260 [Iris pallida]
MGVDYYKTLHVDRNTKDDDIKKAYHRLAIRWHPDKNPNNVKEAEAKFKEICRAYDVLSDPRKRALYEQFGEEGIDGGAPPPPPTPAPAPRRGGGGGGRAEEALDFSNPLEALRERLMREDAMKRGGARVPAIARKRTHTERTLACSLEELYGGNCKKIKVSMEVLSPAGTATTVDEILTIDIKPGWKKGTKVTFPAKGGSEHNLPTDLVFVIDERPHGVFKREGNDLIITQEISLREALTGCTVHLTTLDGRNLSVPVNSVISPSYEEVIQGEGMPITKESSKKGDLRIRFQIKFPTMLTPEQRTGIMELLPP